MKKTLLALLVLATLLFSVACSATTSDNPNIEHSGSGKMAKNLTISNIESVLELSEANAQTYLTSTNDGYNFSGNFNYLYRNCSYKGRSDTDKNIYEADITYKGIETSYLSTKEEVDRIMELLTSQSGEILHGETMACFPIVDYTQLVKLVCHNFNKLTIDQVHEIIYDNKVLAVDGWEFSCSLDHTNKTVTIHLEKAD